MSRLLLAFLLTATIQSTVAADVSVRRRAADLFELTDGTRLFGVKLDSQADSHIRLLLRTEWLQHHAPQLLQHPSDNVDSARKELVSRLEHHIADLKQAGNRGIEELGYLQEQLMIVSQSDDAAKLPSLTILTFPASVVRQKLLKPDHARQIAGMSILNNVDGAETESPTTLQQQLRNLAPASLMTTVPDTVAPSSLADQQFQRITLNANRIFGTTSRIIFFNKRFLSEADIRKSGKDLTTELLVGEVQNQFGSLLNSFDGVPAGFNQSDTTSLPETLPPAAEVIAKRESANVVEITELKLAPTDGTARVAITLYQLNAQTKEWQKQQAFTSSAALKDITADQQQRIANDPQIKQVTSLFGQLGIRDNQLKNAIGMGAVVEVAQNRARQDLNKLLTNNSASPGLSPAVLSITLNPPLPPKAAQPE